ncbi:MAG: esterase family protein [Clostridia bacterium]|nr:esterase family protein [Clostridia bacterium]
MALMETHYYSFSMESNVTLNVFIPTPGSNCSISDLESNERFDYETGLPVVYLLHGAYGDAFSWLRFSNVERYAQERGIALVMASAGNSFYQNMRCRQNYKDFFTKELPVFIRNVFPVTKDPKKTFVAGFSMGGYGAWYLGLTRPDVFGKAASMSGALDIATLYDTIDPNVNVFAWEDCFGEAVENGNHLPGSPYDLFALYDKAVREGYSPKLYQACGTEDFLYKLNQDVRDKMVSRRADLTYEEGPGGHDWDFWDIYIRHILDWFLQ